VVASQTRWSDASRLLRPPARFAAVFGPTPSPLDYPDQLRLITEPARPEDGGDEGVLRNLLVASLNPQV
jgi:hypothetical protein